MPGNRDVVRTVTVEFVGDISKFSASLKSFESEAVEAGKLAGAALLRGMDADALENAAKSIGERIGEGVGAGVDKGVERKANKSLAELRRHLRLVNEEAGLVAARFKSQLASTDASRAGIDRLSRELQGLRARASGSRDTMLLFERALLSVDRAQRDLAMETRSVSGDVRSLVNEVNVLRNEYQRTGEDADGVVSRLQELQEQISAMSSALEQGEGGWGRYNQQITQLARAGRLADATISGIEGRMSRLGLASQVTLAGQNLINQSFSRFGPIGLVFAQRVGQMTTAMSALNAVLLGGGIALGFGAITKAVQALKSALEEMEQFEYGVRTLAAAGQEFERSDLSGQLDAIARSAGRAGEQFTRADLSAAIARLIKAGVDASQAMDLLAPSMELAAVSGQDLTDASMSLLTNLRQFGATTRDAGRFADALARGELLAAEGAKELSEGMRVVGPLANAAGMEFEEVLGILVELSNKGMSAADLGATGLRSSLAALFRPTGEAKDVLAALGVELVDTTGRARPMLDIMYELIEALDGYSEAGQAAARLFDTRAISTFLAISETSQDFAENLLDAAGAAGDYADTFLSENLAASARSMANAWKDLANTIAQVVAPWLTWVYEQLGSILRTLNEFITGTERVSLFEAQAGVIFTGEDRFVVEGLLEDIEVATAAVKAWDKEVRALEKLVADQERVFGDANQANKDALERATNNWIAWGRQLQEAQHTLNRITLSARERGDTPPPEVPNDFDDPIQTSKVRTATDAWEDLARAIRGADALALAFGNTTQAQLTAMETKQGAVNRAIDELVTKFNVDPMSQGIQDLVKQFGDLGHSIDEVHAAFERLDRIAVRRASVDDSAVVTPEAMDLVRKRREIERAIASGLDPELVQGMIDEYVRVATAFSPKQARDYEDWGEKAAYRANVAFGEAYRQYLEENPNLLISGMEFNQTSGAMLRDFFAGMSDALNDMRVAAEASGESFDYLDARQKLMRDSIADLASNYSNLTDAQQGFVDAMLGELDALDRVIAARVEAARIAGVRSEGMERQSWALAIDGAESYGEALVALSNQFGVLSLEMMRFAQETFDPQGIDELERAIKNLVRLGASDAEILRAIEALLSVDARSLADLDKLTDGWWAAYRAREAYWGVIGDPVKLFDEDPSRIIDIHSTVVDMLDVQVARGINSQKALADAFGESFDYVGAKQSVLVGIIENLVARIDDLSDAERNVLDEAKRVLAGLNAELERAEQGAAFDSWLAGVNLIGIDLDDIDRAAVALTELGLSSDQLAQAWDALEGARARDDSKKWERTLSSLRNSLGLTANKFDEMRQAARNALSDDPAALTEALGLIDVAEKVERFNDLADSMEGVGSVIPGLVADYEIFTLLLSENEPMAAATLALDSVSGALIGLMDASEDSAAAFDFLVGALATAAESIAPGAGQVVGFVANLVKSIADWFSDGTKEVNERAAAIGASAGAYIGEGLKDSLKQGATEQEQRYFLWFIPAGTKSKLNEDAFRAGLNAAQSFGEGLAGVIRAGAGFKDAFQGFFNDLLIEQIIGDLLLSEKFQDILEQAGEAMQAGDYAGAAAIAQRGYAELGRAADAVEQILQTRAKSIAESITGAFESVFQAADFSGVMSNWNALITDTTRTALIEGFMQSAAMKPVFDKLGAVIAKATADGVLTRAEMDEIRRVADSAEQPMRVFFEALEELGLGFSDLAEVTNNLSMSFGDVFDSFTVEEAVEKWGGLVKNTTRDALIEAFTESALIKPMLDDLMEHIVDYVFGGDLTQVNLDRIKEMASDMDEHVESFFWLLEELGLGFGDLNKVTNDLASSMKNVPTILRTVTHSLDASTPYYMSMGTGGVIDGSDRFEGERLVINIHGDVSDPEGFLALLDEHLDERDARRGLQGAGRRF